MFPESEADPLLGGGGVVFFFHPGSTAQSISSI